MRNHVCFCLSILGLVAACVLPTLAGEKPPKPAGGLPDEQRIEQWAAMLPEHPRGVGPTIDDRQAWDVVGKSNEFKRVVDRADKLLATPMPEVTDDLYLDFSRTGNRVRFERVQNERTRRVETLVLAECIENRGRFLPAIEEAIQAECGDKSWSMPAHDRQLAIFHGTEIAIDLRVADVSWMLATARYWLGDRLQPTTRQLIVDELERRTFKPMTDWLATGKPRMWWLTGTNNWNAVCLAGVTGAAMASIESRERRALFAAAAEKYIKYFLDGFTPDGYCSEGVGYWNYGFGHYLLLAETLAQATDGRVDMMLWPNVAGIAQYARRVEILPGVFPPFADCSITARPDPKIMAFLSRRYQWGLTKIETKGLGPASGPSGLFATGLYCFPNSATATSAVKAADGRLPLRDWFADAQVLICRPAAESDAQNAIGVALKGGHNAEQHNHNDVGSYVVALGRSMPLVDPGNETYTARTFGPGRYESKVLNSFGHAVPLVAGRLQESGRQAAASVMKTEFTANDDTLVLDLSAAYKIEPLQTLTRTFVYSRNGQGSLTVTDAVVFETPQSFGTALITFDKWTQIDQNHLRVGEGDSAVAVEINADGGEFQITAEEIHEELPNDRVPVRIGINMAKPVTNAKIVLRIAPEAY